MSEAKQDRRLRLVPLVFTEQGIPRSGQEIDLVLNWAARGKTRLYIEVPPTDVAYADPNFTAGRRPSGTEMRTLSTNGSEFREHMGKPPRITRHDDDDSSLMITLGGEVHPEVTHLALGPWHAEELRTQYRTTLNIFPASLKPHSDARLAQQGWLISSQIPSALRLCSSDRVTDGVVTSLLVDQHLGSKARFHSELSSSPAVVEQKNILIDALLEDELTVKLGKPQEDPYGLRDGAYGVYLLYCAAENFYRLLVNEQVQRDDVELWVSSKEPNLFQKTVAHHAVKLITPRHHRGRGVKKANQSEIHPEVVAPDLFRPGHDRPEFVTKGLALLIIVARWWIDECNKVNGKPAVARPDHDTVDKRLKGLGFLEKETPFLRRVVRWSQPQKLR